MTGQEGGRAAFVTGGNAFGLCSTMSRLPTTDNPMAMQKRTKIQRGMGDA